MEGGKEKEIRLSTNRNVWGRKGPEVVGRKNRISSWRISPTNSTLLIEFVKCQLYRCLCSLFLFFRQSPCLKTWHSYKRVGFWLPDFVKFWTQVPSLSNLLCECGWHILWNGMLVISIQMNKITWINSNVHHASNYSSSKLMRQYSFLTAIIIIILGNEKMN